MALRIRRGPHAILRPPARDGRGDGSEEGAAPKLANVLADEAVLRADGIQDLAEQIPVLVKAAVGHDLKFQVQVRFDDETPPEPGVVDRINALLAEVSEDWKLK